MDDVADRIALVDMDGTVADADAAFREALGSMRSPGEPDPASFARGEQPGWLRARRRYVKAFPGFWRNLRPIEAGVRAVGIMREVGFDVHVLTKAADGAPLCRQEKVEWCEEHLPGLPVNLVGSKHGKGLVYGRVLFDDWVPYVEDWLRWRPRGFVVMPAWPHNEGFGGQNVMRYDMGLSGEELLAQERMLRTRLKITFSRAAREP